MRWINFINGTFLRLALYNDTTNTRISPSAHCESVSNNGPFTGSPNFSHLVTVGATPLVVGVRTSAGNTTNSALGDGDMGPTILIQSID